MDAAEMAATLASPLTMAAAGIFSTGSGCRRPAPAGGQQAQALDGALHGQQRGLQDVEAVDLLRAGLGDAQHSALP
jgi:hypothetical protein